MEILNTLLIKELSMKFYGWKYPKTTQEKKKIFDSIDNDITPRGSRSFRQLPDAWDDKPRTNLRSRNWKHYRKTQYKGV